MYRMLSEFTAYKYEKKSKSLEVKNCSSIWRVLSSVQHRNKQNKKKKQHKDEWKETHKTKQFHKLKNCSEMKTVISWIFTSHYQQVLCRY